MVTDTDADYFFELQTQTGWGRTLADFATWCQVKHGWFILDVGCGPGLLPALFAEKGCRAIGIDLDFDMLARHPVHPYIIQADGASLPFPSAVFDLVTASNLLFLVTQPERMVQEFARVTRKGGQIAVLNPSELLNETAAMNLADRRNLYGLARESLINWARRAETNQRWTETETTALFKTAGIIRLEVEMKIGPGFARYARGRV